MAEWTVIDTDILIDVGRNVEPAVEFLERLGSGSRLGVSTVTQMEMIVGFRFEVDRSVFDDLPESRYTGDEENTNEQ